MKKIVLLIITIFLVTACSAEYNITIQDDLSIIEEAKLSGTDEFFANYYKTTRKNVLKSFLDVYKENLDENGYTYELEEETPYVTVKKSYNSIKDYLDKSVLFNDYFDEIKYTENGNIKKIETIGFNENNPDDPNRFDVKKLEIIITCPYKVKNHNAARVNKETNTYYYELEDDNDLKILLEFDASKKYNPHEDAILAIIIGLGIIIIGWTTIYVLNKKKKR